MKFLFQLLAALLLWMFIACNNKTGQTNSKTTDGGAAAELKTADTDDADVASVPAPAPVEMNKYT
ncbi:MAG TPA: hypothetical protein VIM79_13900, partial [Niastella sp.]